LSVFFPGRATVPFSVKVSCTHWMDGRWYLCRRRIPLRYGPWSGTPAGISG
jgi:hypothetical protein